MRVRLARWLRHFASRIEPPPSVRALPFTPKARFVAFKSDAFTLNGWRTP